MNNFQPSQLRILASDDEDAMLDLYRKTLSSEKGNNKLFAEIGELLAELYGKAEGSLIRTGETPGFELVCCREGNETIDAVKTAVQENRHFAVAFIDIHIPRGSDGIRIAEHIRRLDPHVEIVMVTSYPHINSVEVARRIPPAHKLLFIRKPFQLQEILQSSSALVSKWLIEREFLKIQSELETRIQERTLALQKERNFISAVLDTAGALVIVLDKDGRVVRFNRACEELSGYAFDEVNGMYIWDLFLIPEDVLPIKDTFENIQNGIFPKKHENYWITRYGSRRLITWSSTCLLDDAGLLEYGIWVGLDITERKEMEEELRSGEERYRALIENVKDGVVLIQDENLIFANDAFATLFGYSGAEKLMGKDIHSLAKRHFDPDFMKFLHTAMDKKSWGLPFRGKCFSQNNREFWTEKRTSVISYKGKPAILITVRDITEMMLWEQTIKQEAEYFRSETVRLKSSIGERYRLVNLIGKSRPMQKIYELILKAAETDANVIISGRSGTGKELVARAIHELSERSDKPFIPVNCGAIPEPLIESEFFGYKKGAFTGANTNKYGYLYTAHTGTLFLDEVGEIGLNMQVKLLRAIEGRDYIPVGDRKPQTADVRIIAATNKNLADMVNHGLMREDFFYRISVIPIILPDLKDRREDIPLLIEHFLRLYAGDAKIETIPANIMDALLSYDWPGNIRELQNVLQRYLTVKSLDFMNISTNDAADTFSNQIFLKNPMDFLEIPDMEKQGFNLHKTVETMEKKLILRALEKVHWNKTKAASLLGISRRSLFRRMKQMGV